jgi:hypothetical protein
MPNGEGEFSQNDVAKFEKYDDGWRLCVVGLGNSPALPAQIQADHVVELDATASVHLPQSRNAGLDL